MGDRAGVVMRVLVDSDGELAPSEGSEEKEVVGLSWRRKSE